MKISLNWIRRYVPLEKLAPQEIAEQLSLKTCEVEGVHVYGRDLDHIVVGKVLQCSKHPNADKLSLTVVDTGQEQTQIVCGANNVAQGQYVAVGKVGVTLPDGTKLKKAKIRGEDSYGMILSEREMGLGEDHAGILVLEGKLEPGTPIYEALPLQDQVLEIDNKSITHRADLWGHYGFAREIAAIFKRELRPLPTMLQALPQGGQEFPVQIQDAEGCARYMALQVKNVQVRPTPAWMRWLLGAVEQKSINNIVDLSNFIMLEIGQPNHAFDAHKIAGGQIVVRRARHGESLQTLDATLCKLATTDLVIADTQKPIALAGVMGGMASAISQTTHTMLVESAWFDPGSVRRTAQRHALRTDASSRFEKSLDPNYAQLAMQRFIFLLAEISPGANILSCNDVGQFSKGAKPRKKIGLRHAVLQERLGISLSEKEVVELLAAVEFSVKVQAKGILEVEVPSFRATKDVTLEEDLIEEVGRFYGYERIPEQTLRAAVLPPPPETERLGVRRLQQCFSLEHCFVETLHYSFLPNHLVEKLSITQQPYVTLTNPLILEQNRIRRNLAVNLLGSLEPALRQQAEVKIFEIGKGYLPEHTNAEGEPGELLQCVAAWAWREAPKLEPFFYAKGLAAALLRRLHVENWTCEDPTSLAKEYPYLHAGKSSALAVNDKIFGFVGELDPDAAHALQLQGARAALIGLDVRALLPLQAAQVQYQPLPKYPGILVDIAVAVPREKTYAQVYEALWKVGGQYLVALEHFDTFAMPDGNQSYAFHARLQSTERTLTDKEEAAFIERVEKAAVRLGGKMRSA